MVGVLKEERRSLALIGGVKDEEAALLCWASIVCAASCRHERRTAVFRVILSLCRSAARRIHRHRHSSARSISHTHLPPANDERLHPLPAAVSKKYRLFSGSFFGLPEGPPDFSWPWFGSLTPESARADLHRRVTQQTQTTPTLHRCIATAIARQMIDVMTLLRRPGEYDALLTRPVREMCMVFWEGNQREPNQDQARDAGPMRFVDCREWDRAPKKAL